MKAGLWVPFSALAALALAFVWGSTNYLARATGMPGEHPALYVRNIGVFAIPAVFAALAITGIIPAVIQMGQNVSGRSRLPPIGVRDATWCRPHRDAHRQRHNRRFRDAQPVRTVRQSPTRQQTFLSEILTGEYNGKKAWDHRRWPAGNDAHRSRQEPAGACLRGRGA